MSVIRESENALMWEYPRVGIALYGTILTQKYLFPRGGTLILKESHVRIPHYRNTVNNKQLINKEDKAIPTKWKIGCERNSRDRGPANLSFINT